MLGLDPESALSRICAEQQTVVLPNLRQSVLVGAIGFGIVGLVVFGQWALAGRWMTRNLGELGFYSILGVSFMVAGGAAFKPILIGRNLGRFYALFVGSFFLYAAIWTVCYMTARAYGQAKLGELLGSVLGPPVMAALIVAAFRARGQMLRCMVVMAACHTAGYFLGDRLFAMDVLRNKMGMLLWGLTYGVGLGAGIAACLYWCQGRLRDTLLKAVRDPVPDPATPSAG